MRSMFGSPPKLRKSKMLSRTATRASKRQPVTTVVRWKFRKSSRKAPLRVRTLVDEVEFVGLAGHARQDAVANARIEIRKGDARVGREPRDQVGVGNQPDV